MISLILKNDKGDFIDLVNDLCIEKSSIHFEWVNDNLFIRQPKRIYGKRSKLLPERTLEPFVFVIKKSKWKEVRNLFVRDQKELSLVYKDDDNIEYMLYVNNPDIKYTPLSYTDWVEISLTFVQLSDLFTSNTYLSNSGNNGDEEDERGKYELEYEIEYPAEEVTDNYNPITIENNGDYDAPIIITIPKGGRNIIWELILGNNITYRGQLIGDYEAEIIINTYKETVTVGGQLVIDKLNTDFVNFFDIPLGTSLINLRGIGIDSYSVTVLDPWRLP